MSNPLYLPLDSVPYADKLKAIYRAERGVDWFPQCCCAMSAMVVEKATSLPVVGGYSRLAPRKADGFTRHFCNVDWKRGFYVDLTLRQFDGKNVTESSFSLPCTDPQYRDYASKIPRIAIVPMNSGILIEDARALEELRRIKFESDEYAIRTMGILKRQGFVC